MTNAKNFGTCPACFQSVMLTGKGLISRHGWKVLGNRQVGHYQQTWHTGPCFGTSYEPFEVSSKGTVDYFWHVVVPAGTRNLNVIAHLDTRPALIVSAASRQTYYVNGTRSYGEQPVQAFYEVRLVSGDEGIKCEKDHYAKVFSYEAEFMKRMDAAKSERVDVLAACEFLCDKVAEWKPQAVKPKVDPVKPVKPTHFRRNGLYTVCGKSHTAVNGRVMAPSTNKPEEVTCPQCKEDLAMFLKQRDPR